MHSFGALVDPSKADRPLIGVSEDGGHEKCKMKHGLLRAVPGHGGWLCGKLRDHIDNTGVDASCYKLDRRNVDKRWRWDRPVGPFRTEEMPAVWRAILPCKNWRQRGSSCSWGMCARGRAARTGLKPRTAFCIIPFPPQAWAVTPVTRRHRFGVTVNHAGEPRETRLHFCVSRPYPLHFLLISMRSGWRVRPLVLCAERSCLIPSYPKSLSSISLQR